MFDTLESSEQSSVYIISFDVDWKQSGYFYLISQQCGHIILMFCLFMNVDIRSVHNVQFAENVLFSGTSSKHKSMWHMRQDKNICDFK